jgi:pimeloyl-ACP methyl ester carboxylesterase
VDVRAARIHYTAWGECGRRGLVFVHGAGAHAHWWTHIAAQFADEFRVAAIDLSGHGDSEHRSHYDLELWADEVHAVIVDAGIAGRPLVIGHSMGGFVTITTAARHPEALAGVIICESPVTTDDRASRAPATDPGAHRVFATVEEAIARFRTDPPQEGNLRFVTEHIVRNGLRQVDTADGPGWSWKFDRGLFYRFDGGMRETATRNLARVRCRVALLRAEFGLVPPDVSTRLPDALGRRAPVVELPQAGHHPMLGQPLVLLTAIRAFVSGWA